MTFVQNDSYSKIDFFKNKSTSVAFSASVAFAVEVHFSVRFISRLQAGHIRLILPTINEPNPIQARELYSLPHYGIMMMLNSRI